MPRLSKIGAACLSAFGFGTGGAAVTASYLVVAGGGGGGYDSAGGGGAGGYQAATTSLSLTTSYTIIVGAGGAGSSAATNKGTSGSNSSITTLTASVGGGGGGSESNKDGAAGGSGGGGDANSTGGGVGGTATSGQGNSGGTGAATTGFTAGGGGGASAAGTAGSGSTGGTGGAGTTSSITGSSVTYAGGGGGGSYVGTPGTGGSGGGGTGASSTVAGSSGSTNLGSGGGGGGSGSYIAGYNGGSGVVVVAYTGAQKFGGGIVSSDGTNTIHTFKTSGQLVPMTPITASYLIVAGGGGGGHSDGGGGGGGGLLSGSALTVDTSSTYLVTVGSGGVGVSSAVTPTSGSNSTFSMVTTVAVGGGYGGSFVGGPQAGGNGGSGGGASNNGASGGSGTSGQGNSGGSSIGAVSPYPAGGGGGAGGAGGTGSGTTSGNGGIGVVSSISGTSTYYAGGGGGGIQTGGTAGTGGLGGGGAGGVSTNGTNGTANTGGGGGGNGNGTSGNGGSGIVIISYAGTTQLMAGGTVTIVGGNVIHTFTSSGYLTPLTFIGRSLRFRSSASAYLNRTPTVAGNRKTWTWSGWVKRGALSTVHEFFSAYDGSAGQTGNIRFAADNTLGLYTGGNTGSRGSISTTAVYRDPAAWYHITAVVDTTQSVSTERLQLYVNGIRQAVTVLETVPQNTDGQINGVFSHRLGNHPSNINYFDGYMADVRFIDGQALTPNSFGTFNVYGVWQPINYGGSYGTNGFHLPFSDTTSTTTLCYDKSPQGNNWTPNNISLTAGSTYDSMTDVPTLTSATASNYCVLNPLAIGGGTISNANLTYARTADPSGSTAGKVLTTIAADSGKWYFEYVIASSSSSIALGVTTNIQGTANTIGGTNYVGNQSYEYLWRSNGQTINNTSFVSYGSSATNTDIVMIAFDVSDGKIWWGKNGTWFNSSNPATGTSPAFSGLSGTMMPILGIGTTSSGFAADGSVNFGQRPFAYTPPTGFVALNTYNL